MAVSLSGARIVVPESRELDLFVSMIERAGGEALRCPLVSIHDLDDPAPVEAWLRRMAGGALDDLVLYTGEGLRRLHGAAERAGIAAEFMAALGRVRTIVRGPKPARVLRGFGLAPGVSVEPPTTEGLAAALADLRPAGRRVGVQLYPGHPDTLLEALAQAGAHVDPILPYRYASDREDARVADAIRAMAAGQVDMIALTSRPQVNRLVDVAAAQELGPALRDAAGRVLVAAVGPVTAEAARQAGWRVAAMPEASFHLKPMIAAMAAALAEKRAA